YARKEKWISVLPVLTLAVYATMLRLIGSRSSSSSMSSSKAAPYDIVAYNSPIFQIIYKLVIFHPLKPLDYCFPHHIILVCGYKNDLRRGVRLGKS
ncbi:MAG: hypothetical protein RSD48_06735, partial [Oscillospiraceae bacterium]